MALVPFESKRSSPTSPLPLKTLKLIIDKAQIAKENPKNPRSEKAERHSKKFEKLYSKARLRSTTQRLKSIACAISNASFFARVGDAWSLRQELELGRGVNERDSESGRTPLVEAVTAGHFDVVRVLLEEFKADVNILTVLGSSSALHLAVENGYRQIASLLLTHGAKIEALDKSGCTPLHLCTKVGIARLLQKNGAFPNIRNRKGHRPSDHYIANTSIYEQSEKLIDFLVNWENKCDIELVKERVEALALKSDSRALIAANHVFESRTQ